MNKQLFPFSEINQFSDFDKSFAQNDESLRSFMAYPSTTNGLIDACSGRKKFDVDRGLLIRVLKRQYEERTNLTARSSELIDLLSKPNTYTITTAHQPCLFSGPLYFIYKIISVLKLAQTLNSGHTDNHIVPCFVLGGEDHDLEEMDHLWLFGKKITWNAEQSGSVGRMTNRNIEDAINEISQILGTGDRSEEICNELRACFSSENSYGTSMLKWVDKWFGDKGLLIVNMDDPELKRSFIPILKEELFKSASVKIVKETQAKLEDVGYKPQAYVRGINLFLLEDGKRSRIEKKKDHFVIIGENKMFTFAEMENLLDKSPESFSPNVVIRPLYQEWVLPNIAYIGGGGELAYWIERKDQFAHFGIHFPVLIRRDSFLWVEKQTIKHWMDSDLEITDLFRDQAEIIKSFVQDHSSVELSLESEQEEIQDVYNRIAEKAGKLEEGLKKWVLSEAAKHNKQMGHIEKRLIRAEKSMHEVSLKRIEKTLDKLFPGGGLQERKDNFMQYYLKNGDSFFDTLYEHADPLDVRLKVLIEE